MEIAFSLKSGIFEGIYFHSHILILEFGVISDTALGSQTGQPVYIPVYTLSPHLR